MFNFLLLSILILLIITSNIVDLNRKKLLLQSLQQYFYDNNLVFDSKIPVLYIHYSSSLLKKLDEILKNEMRSSIYVIFDAPTWLFETKKKQWYGTVIDPNYISEKSLINSHRSKVFLLEQTSYISEVTTYLEEQYS